MNIELLTKLREKFRNYPSSIAMAVWVSDFDEDTVPCGTVACIAGHAVLEVKGKEWLKEHEPSTAEQGNAIFRDRCYLPNGAVVEAVVQVADIPKCAMEALELTPAQAARLFYTGQWPGNLEDEYNHCYEDAKRAEVVCKRIDHFINTGGEE